MFCLHRISISPKAAGTMFKEKGVWVPTISDKTPVHADTTRLLGTKKAVYTLTTDHEFGNNEFIVVSYKGDTKLD